MALAFDGQLVWVANDWSLASGTIQAIDVTTDRVTKKTWVPGTPSDFLIDGTRLWVSNDGAGIYWIDRATARVNTLVEPPTDQRWRESTYLAYGGGRLWLVDNNRRTVFTVDPTTGSLTNVLPDVHPTKPLREGTRLWLVTGRMGADKDLITFLQFIDLITGKISAPIEIKSPAAIAFDGARLWLAYPMENAIRSLYVSDESSVH
jgi:hypothetical protein